MLPFLAIHNLVAWWQLTSANDVEHCGWLRRRSEAAGAHEGGTGYEAPQPHHSWNTNQLVSNLVTFHLQRHSDHHAPPARRDQCLRDVAQLPRLPSGYFGMFALAHLPPLWFRVMDKRLLALPQAQGDSSRVNVDPRRRAALVARHGPCSAALGSEGCA
jgi:alkane 1-monooxygenase